MSSSTATLAAVPSTVRAVHRRTWHGGLQGSDLIWAIAFVLPYIAVFFAFVAYPVGYGIWLGSNPASYWALFADPVLVPRQTRAGDRLVAYLGRRPGGTAAAAPGTKDA